MDVDVLDRRSTPVVRTPRDARRRIRVGVALYGACLVALLLAGAWLAPTGELPSDRAPVADPAATTLQVR